MRVVLDSNVIIAAFATRGLCEAVFEYCLEAHEVFICEEMLKEVSDKLLRKIRAPASVVADVDSYVRSGAEVVRPCHVSSETCRDKRDLVVLGTAEAAQADYLISGDMDLLSLRRFQNTVIVTPRRFWESARKKKKKNR